jgi:uncharacterized protein YbjQ (UPF0145 family)
MWCRAGNHAFTTRKDPAQATIGDLAGDMAGHGLSFAPARVGKTREQEDLDRVPMLIVTMNEIPGYRIIKVHGDVFGLIVRARNVFSNMGAQLMTVAGGEVGAYTKLLVESRNQARARMWREARERGANAIIAMRFDCNEIGNIMSEVAAYGTAVTVEPLESDDASPSIGGMATAGERPA